MTSPTATAPEVRAPTDTSAAQPATERQDEGRTLVRWLEVVAAGALVLSLAYVFVRGRSASRNSPGG